MEYFEEDYMSQADYDRERFADTDGGAWHQDLSDEPIGCNLPDWNELVKHNSKLGSVVGVPWPDVERIAAFVRGDGTDAQRQALADGILSGWQSASTVDSTASEIEDDLPF